MHSLKQTTSPMSHTTWQRPDLQTWLSPHVPQVPPQPSSLQFRPSQLGEQHVPSEQTWLLWHWPQLPPQPSPPQDLPAQDVVQTCGGGDDCWQAPTVAPSRSSFFRAFLETVTVCPVRQSVTFFFFLFPFLASTS